MTSLLTLKCLNLAKCSVVQFHPCPLSSGTEKQSHLTLEGQSNHVVSTLSYLKCLNLAKCAAVQFHPCPQDVHSINVRLRQVEWIETESVGT